MDEATEEDVSSALKHLAQQINNKSCNGNISNLEGSPMMSPKVLMNTLVDDLNSLEETKAEIQRRLDSFEHIRENHFMCARYVYFTMEFLDVFLKFPPFLPGGRISNPIWNVIAQYPKRTLRKVSKAVVKIASTDCS